MNDSEREAFDQEFDVEETQSRLDADDPEEVRSAIDDLRAVASREPEALFDVLEEIVDLLEHEAGEVRAGAVMAIAWAGAARPALVEPHLSDVADRFDDEYDVVRWHALKVFRAMAPDSRDAIRPYAGAIADFLDSSHLQARRDAAFCLGNLSMAHPDAAVESVPELVSVFRETTEIDPGEGSEDVPLQMKRDAERDSDERFDDEREAMRNGRIAAGHALFEASTAAPGAVAEHLDSIAELLDDEEYLVREAAADVVFGVASREPESAADCVESLDGRLADEDVPAVRRSIAKALNAISVADPGAVAAVAVERADSLRPMLDAETPSTRGAAAALLALAAERDPTVVEPAADRLQDIAESDDTDYVREAATAALEAV